MPKKEKDNKNKGDSAKKQTKNPNACLANKSKKAWIFLLSLYLIWASNKYAVLIW